MGWQRRLARQAENVGGGARAGRGARAGTPRPRWPPLPPPGRPPAVVQGCGPGRAAAPWPGGRGAAPPRRALESSAARPARPTQAGRPTAGPTGPSPPLPSRPPRPFRLCAGAAPGAGRARGPARPRRGHPTHPGGPRSSPTISGSVSTNSGDAPYISAVHSHTPPTMLRGPHRPQGPETQSPTIPGSAPTQPEIPPNSWVPPQNPDALSPIDPHTLSWPLWCLLFVPETFPQCQGHPKNLRKHPQISEVL